MTRRADTRTIRTPVAQAIAQGDQLPDFTPVPRQNVRHDGWTPERQREFIEALADTGSVAAACKAVDMSTVGAYYLRRQAGAESFRAAWEAALAFGVRRLEDVAMERALNGVEEPFYVYGQHVGTRKKYNDRLLMFLLRNRSPERFGVGVNGGSGSTKGLNAVGKMEKKRLKQKWRRQWEEEREQSGTSPAEVRASIDRKIKGIRRQVEAERAREWERMSDETRAAWDRFVELRDADFERLNADADMRRRHERGPTVYEEWSKPQPRRVTAPKEVKTVHRLKDDGGSEGAPTPHPR
jgi:hypothetical protein